MTGSAGEIREITTAAPATDSVRAGVLAAVTVSLVTLAIATFELSIADWPSGFVLLVIVPLAALLFFSCLLWSASQLLRIRKDGAKFALPFLICALTLAALVYAPLQQIYLQHDFWARRTDREKIVARVESGELFPNVTYNKNLIALGDKGPRVSAGNDIVIDDRDEGAYVLFLTSRGLKHHFTGFLRVPPGGDPKKFFEFVDKPPTRLVQYDKDWWFVGN
jgi:hypothetical protein